MYTVNAYYSRDHQSAQNFEVKLLTTASVTHLTHLFDEKQQTLAKKNYESESQPKVIN